MRLLTGGIGAILRGRGGIGTLGRAYLQRRNISRARVMILDPFDGRPADGDALIAEHVRRIGLAEEAFAENDPNTVYLVVNPEFAAHSSSEVSLISGMLRGVARLLGFTAGLTPYSAQDAADLSAALSERMKASTVDNLIYTSGSMVHETGDIAADGRRVIANSGLIVAQGGELVQMIKANESTIDPTLPLANEYAFTKDGTGPRAIRCVDRYGDGNDVVTELISCVDATIEKAAVRRSDAAVIMAMGTPDKMVQRDTSLLIVADRQDSIYAIALDREPLGKTGVWDKAIGQLDGDGIAARELTLSPGDVQVGLDLLSPTREEIAKRFVLGISAGDATLLDRGTGAIIVDRDLDGAGGAAAELDRLAQSGEVPDVAVFWAGRGDGSGGSKPAPLPAGMVTTDPTGHESIDPNSGQTTDPNAGLTVDPNTGKTTDPITGLTIDPTTGLVIDPAEGHPGEGGGGHEGGSGI